MILTWSENKILCMQKGKETKQLGVHLTFGSTSSWGWRPRPRAPRHPPKQLTHRLHRAAVPDEVRTDSRAREASGVLRAASCRGSGDGVRPAAWTAAAQLLWLGDPGRETALKRRAGEGGRCPGSPAPTLASSTHALYAVGKPSRAPIDFLLHPVLLNSLWLK